MLGGDSAESASARQEMVQIPTSHNTPTFEDPFASPRQPTNSPALPEPCARPPRKPRLKDPPAAASVIYVNTAHDRHPEQGKYYKSTSLSSATTGGSSMVTGNESVDLEKGSPQKEHARQQSKQHGVKAAPQMAPRDHHPRHSPQRSAERVNNTFDEDDDVDDHGEQVQSRNAVKILLFLSGPCVALSFINFFWTLISLVITTLSQPVRLCARRISFGAQLCSLLGPALNLQLRSIHTPLPPYANEDGSYYAFKLVGVNLLSPFLSIGVAIAAWVIAIYWLMAGIVGDPAGLDGRDDGKETVLGLRRWWEGWLMRAVKLT